ncbi:MAG: hypothetical protein COB20_12895 [SAR86 cluster bacterium]|uniref:DUF4142 domain-containing protein n=1 Tax=SAR86 cluster bacterium TaxID=2030880 RepID=A0A2A4WZF1_9GAMM|nr:MAG: hypothetical protein COB20_12895 [SAR86 cluster bacterium]
MNLKTASFLGAAILTSCTLSAQSQSPAELNDLQIAHVAYIADNIDIQYAHLALALSENPTVREFAQTMVRDHNGVNAQALALLKKLDAQPQNNFLSESLQADAKGIINNLASLRGAEFDRAYAENELAYHQAVNGLIENTFIPNIDNAEVKALFIAGLEIFKAHEAAAKLMVSNVR